MKISLDFVLHIIADYGIIRGNKKRKVHIHADRNRREAILWNPKVD